MKTKKQANKPNTTQNIHFTHIYIYINNISTRKNKIGVLLNMLVRNVTFPHIKRQNYYKIYINFKRN